MAVVTADEPEYINGQDPDGTSIRGDLTITGDLTVVGTITTQGETEGTVTSVSVVTANGVSGTVATATTTPAITLALGAIVPTTVNGLTLAPQTNGFTIAGGTTSKTLTVALDANVAGTNTGDQTTVSGNAGSATVLQTARDINGVAFNGSANITVTAAAGTLSGATLAAGVTASSLTSVGTLASLAVTGNVDVGGNVNVNGAANVADYGVNVLAQYLAVTGTYPIQNFGVGVPGDANYEILGFQHDGVSGCSINVTKGGTGAYRALSINNDGATQMTFPAAGGVTLGNILSMKSASFSNEVYTFPTVASGTPGVQYARQIGTMSASRVVNLAPASSYPVGTIIIVADESGTTDVTNTLVITRAGADTINGATTKTIGVVGGYDVAMLMSNGVDKWTVLNSI